MNNNSNMWIMDTRVVYVYVLGHTYFGPSVERKGSVGVGVTLEVRIRRPSYFTLWHVLLEAKDGDLVKLILT
jgi:hypothetical protein